ncbi:MAG: IclR family transcriptional regulator [Candidatus Promineifilaceae bacterium]|nr:IclR family transcriptional regulator [Candidatus Promineifilaceae bacterium]
MTIQSIDRAVAILRSFTESEPELGVTELARRLGLHKSTVSRILSTLQQQGLVSQNPDTNRYRLGLGLISLAGVALGSLDVRAVSQPYLNDLVIETQETVNVTVREGNECVNIERARSPQPIRYVGWIGRRMPLHCTAAGKVLVAFLPDPVRETSLSGPLAAYTDRTVTQPPALEAELAEICCRGYAIVHEEFEVGFSGIAAPIFNHAGSVVAAVSISGPTYRMGPGEIELFRGPLLETAARISKEMGYQTFNQPSLVPQAFGPVEESGA